jgi:2,3,4,5-tetrahydropyridine-2-carboxylate N-succinyltransferase
MRGFTSRAQRRHPGDAPEEVPGGRVGVPCALIIGKRSESTDRKVSLNAALRDFAVPV